MLNPIFLLFLALVALFIAHVVRECLRYRSIPRGVEATFGVPELSLLEQIRIDRKRYQAFKYAWLSSEILGYSLWYKTLSGTWLPISASQVPKCYLDLLEEYSKGPYVLRKFELDFHTLNITRTIVTYPPAAPSIYVADLKLPFSEHELMLLENDD